MSNYDWKNDRQNDFLFLTFVKRNLNEIIKEQIIENIIFEINLYLWKGAVTISSYVFCTAINYNFLRERKRTNTYN